MAHRRKLIPVTGAQCCLISASECATLEATLRKILTPKFFWMFIAYAFALASTRAAEPFQAAAPAADQQSTACGAKAYCYDTPHFAATVTSFRTSTVNGYKIIDTSIRFLNKTDQPLILGYVTASGFATDDRGNRSAVGGPNGYRGIGLVVGNNFDPKMIVRPGGWGEAQFELVLQGSPEIVGFHYVLDLTVAEIKTLEGNQHMLDGEFPLHFEGLANGVSQGAGSFAGAPDGLANAVSNLKSIFGKKKAVQNAATVANSAASTAAAVNAAANSAASQSSPAAVANTLGQAAQKGQPQQKSGQQPGQRPDGRGHPSAQNQNNDSGPFKPPAGTKIEEKVLAPLQQGARFMVSPHGVHVATTEMDGSRPVVYYDGVEGPKFDALLNGAANEVIVFSPDGKRYAYCARSGTQYVAMVDGKELVRSNELQGGACSRTGSPSSDLRFTSNSQHVYYFASIKETQPIDQYVSRFVFDGKAEMRIAGPVGVTFSPDGNHYAYIGDDPDRKRSQMLIVDGKPAGYLAGNMVWSNDSKHLYTQKQVPLATELLLDGKPLMRAFGFEVHIPPVGDMVVVAVAGGDSGHPHSFLVVNGKKVPGSETVERGQILEVVFSPDGKHYAAHCAGINNDHYVIADGKRGQEYSDIKNLGFTPDSSIVVYSAIKGRGFVVVGDQEYASQFDGPKPIMPQVGNRVGAILSMNNAPELLMDGKVTRLNYRGANELSFSPDGTHYAYFALDQGMGYSLVIDGVPQPQSAMPLDGYRIDLEQPVTASRYIFSPDSKHVAHFGFANTAAGRANGIFLDGKFIPASLEGPNTKLVFSPDSKHLFWIHMYGDQPHRVFIDGKPLVDFYPAGHNLANWWDFGPDGTLSFLAQDDNSLKRITIMPSAETSVANLTGGATIASRN
jgi:hypothetical protein